MYVMHMIAMPEKMNYMLLLIYSVLRLCYCHSQQSNIFQSHFTDSGNMSNIANSSEGIPCSRYKELRPYKDRKALDKECIISFTPSSKQYFTYKVMKYKFKFVPIHLRFLNLSSQTEIHYTRCVIQPMDWIWTFRGVEGNYGGRQYLTWPPEYGTLSIGMLKAHTSIPLHMNLTVQGKCDLVIGAKNTTMRLAMAFNNFTNDLALTKDEYNYSYWCYKERIFVENYFLYQLCLHVICPIETIGYRCCKHTYDVNIHGFTIRCPGHFYVFDGVWWVCPFVIGFILYLYFALMLFSLLSMLYKHLPLITGNSSKNFQQIPSICKQKYKNVSASMNLKEKEKWIHHNPVTLFAICVMPLRKCCRLYPVLTSRVLRFIIAALSVTIIFLKVFVHFQYDRAFIIESVKQGAPMNFLSMIAGYQLSKHNFLIFLGGPYVALGAYLLCFVVLVCSPKCFSDFLEVGLPEKTNKPRFVVTIDLKLREFFGSRRILTFREDGYAKIQKTMLANIFSLLNPRFWKYAISLQIGRFKHIAEKLIGDNIVLNCFKVIAFVFPYLAFCFFELLFTLMCYGFPTVFAIGLVYRAYSRNVYDWLKNKKIGYPAMFVVLPVCIVLLTFTVYMFSIIFIDSFIFLARVAIFTYTGLFANPSYTEGYLIFSITVTMYLYDSTNSINETYERLFNQTKKVCKRLNSLLVEDCSVILHIKDIEGARIPLELYMFVVDAQKPKRVEILKSFLKITTIFLCLYISVGILTRFDGFQQLSVVTQTATTTFVCLVPKIFTRMCTLNERREILQMRSKIHKHVEHFLLYKGVECGGIKSKNGTENMNMDSDVENSLS